MMRRFFLLVFFALCCGQALAHKASDSYLVLEVKGAEVSGQWDIALRDLDFALGLDADGNGDINWGELRARHADIAAWALSALTLERGGVCPLKVSQHQVDEHPDGAYAVLSLNGTCPYSTRYVGRPSRTKCSTSEQSRRRSKQIAGAASGVTSRTGSPVDFTCFCGR